LRESGIDHVEQVWKAAKKKETAVLNSLEKLKTDAEWCIRSSRTLAIVNLFTITRYDA
jgi:hypothetical protein